MKDKDAHQHCTDSANARPNGISNADGYGLRGFCQQNGTQHIEQAEARNPKPPLGANSQFGLAETESEAGFT